MGAEPSNFGSSALGPVRAGVGVPLFHAAWLFALGIVIAHFVWLRPAYLLIALAPVAIVMRDCGVASRSVRLVASGVSVVSAGRMVCGDAATAVTCACTGWRFPTD